MMRRAFLVALILVTAGATAWTQQPPTYDLTLTPQHVHWGYYDSRATPVLRVNSATVSG
jgi:hypothetical protein